jgi:hypothetical protein
MARIMDLADTTNATVASLNYDLVVEDVLNKAGVSYDYGISSWNEKKLVSFVTGRRSLRLIKLHGSMNWFGNDDHILVDPEKPGALAPLMVFGGASGKLRPDGPFLQLRHEFERQLLSTNSFVIIGYSFGDGHLNAIIRRWVSTRRKAKLILVNPSTLDFSIGALGTPYKHTKEYKIDSKTVDIVHIKKKTAEAVDDLIDQSNRPIDLQIQKRDGSLPHALVKIVS